MAPRKPKRSPLLEWASAAVGLAILITLVALLGLEAVSQRNGVPPILDADVASVTTAGGRHVVEVVVSNRSHVTGAGVQVEGALKRGGEEVESSTTTISFVPGESQRRGGLIFTRDPRAFELELRVTGYERP